MMSLADDVCGDDGGDPRKFHEKPWNAPKQATHKGLQLCSQAQRALHSALAGCAESVLRDASLVSVEPAPHTGRLRVVLAAGEDTGDRTALEAALDRAAGFLRAEVASAINRRHAPELVFEVV